MKPSLKKSRILVIRGGRSNEREISFQSGAQVEKALLSRSHDVIGMDVTPELFKFLLNEKVDGVFIALHGKWGEDGTLQGTLEMLGIPYTGSGVLASALAMDKLLSKRVFQSCGLPTPPWQELKMVNGKLATLPLIRFPAVVKPACGGSTVGTSKVETEKEVLRAVEKAFKEDSRVFVENYIEGREFTVGIFGKSEPMALPVVEIRLEAFFDYENKYTPGRAQHLLPAPLDPQAYQTAQDLALKAHLALGCSGFSRIDLRYSSENQFYILEVNTIPGLTSQSLFPEAAKAAGISFEDLVEHLVQWAIEK